MNRKEGKLSTEHSFTIGQIWRIVKQLRRVGSDRLILIFSICEHLQIH